MEPRCRPLLKGHVKSVRKQRHMAERTAAVLFSTHGPGSSEETCNLYFTKLAPSHPALWTAEGVARWMESDPTTSPFASTCKKLNIDGQMLLTLQTLDDVKHALRIDAIGRRIMILKRIEVLRTTLRIFSPHLAGRLSSSSLRVSSLTCASSDSLPDSPDSEYTSFSSAAASPKIYRSASASFSRLLCSPSPVPIAKTRCRRCLHLQSYPFLIPFHHLTFFERLVRPANSFVYPSISTLQGSSLSSLSSNCFVDSRSLRSPFPSLISRHSCDSSSSQSASGHSQRSSCRPHRWAKPNCKSVSPPCLWDVFSLFIHFGVTSRVTHRGRWLGMSVAIKVFVGCLTHGAAWWSTVRRILRLRHPNLLTPLGVAVRPPLYCLVSEFLPGLSVADQIATAQRLPSSCAPRKAVHVTQNDMVMGGQRVDSVRKKQQGAPALDSSPATQAIEHRHKSTPAHVLCRRRVVRRRLPANADLQGSHMLETCWRQKRQLRNTQNGVENAGLLGGGLPNEPEEKEGIKQPYTELRKKCSCEIGAYGIAGNAKGEIAEKVAPDKARKIPVVSLPCMSAVLPTSASAISFTPPSVKQSSARRTTSNVLPPNSCAHLGMRVVKKCPDVWRMRARRRRRIVTYKSNGNSTKSMHKACRSFADFADNGSLSFCSCDHYWPMVSFSGSSRSAKTYRNCGPARRLFTPTHPSFAQPKARLFCRCSLERGPSCAIPRRSPIFKQWSHWRSNSSHFSIFNAASSSVPLTFLAMSSWVATAFRCLTVTGWLGWRKDATWSPYDLSEALEIAHQVAHACQYVDSLRLYDINISPSNVLFDQAGKIKLADVGARWLAKCFAEAPLHCGKYDQPEAIV
eukprot:GHVT01054194.1.p1 GENE.GHVT01054194.1~~GHVT01054194.1.p1  ORF type:complete len:853 (-),score=43.82 GHVT01054194.1:3134-5692(-)